MKQRGNEPLGIFLNNPGNLEWGSPWQGLVPRDESYYQRGGTSQQRRFAQFKTPAWGIRALARTLITYYDHHGIDTVWGAISRWAPSIENDVQSYASFVAHMMGVGTHDNLNFHDYRVLRPMVEAIIRFENGPGPVDSDNSWYENYVVDEAMRLAGVVPEKKNVLATPQGAAAGTAVAAGSVAVVTELAQQATSVMGHIQGVMGATEGMSDWLRLTIIALTIVAVGSSAWVLYSKRREIKASEC